MKDILTVRDVSAMTDGLISEATLRWYRATGQGGPRSGRLGRRVVYRRADVEAWIAAAFADSAAPASSIGLRRHSHGPQPSWSVHSPAGGRFLHFRAPAGLSNLPCQTAGLWWWAPGFSC
jgi:predicted DNA-binding transcriptional regulator AlpA